MHQEIFDQYLEERYFKQMAYYSKASAKNQTRYRWFQWILIVLSALTPVFAAFNGIKFEKLDFTHLNILVVAVSSIVAILTTGLKTFNYQELWISYRATYEKLKPEIHYYHFGIGPYAGGVDQEAVFVSRIESILNAEHLQWPTSVNSNKGQEKSKSSDTGEPNDANTNGPIESSEGNKE